MIERTSMTTVMLVGAEDALALVPDARLSTAPADTRAQVDDLAA